jgi:exodeoxyribonuclease-3
MRVPSSGQPTRISLPGHSVILTRPYRRLVAQGWTDALRALHPDERIYTFWKYFRNAFACDLFPPDVRAFKDHAAFHRVPERWEF